MSAEVNRFDDHAEQAIRLLEVAEDMDFRIEVRQIAAQMAQVHATLAEFYLQREVRRGG